MNAIESTKHYKERIKKEVKNTLTETTFPIGTKKTGKVVISKNLRIRLLLSQQTDKVPLIGF